MTSGEITAQPPTKTGDQQSAENLETKYFSTVTERGMLVKQIFSPLHGPIRGDKPHVSDNGAQ